MKKHNRVIFGMEDITADIDKSRDRFSPGGLQPLIQQSFMGRALGIGILYTLHHPSICPSLIQNTETLIVSRLQGIDDRELTTLLGTKTAEQNHRIRSLQPGEFVAWCPSSWDQPVFATFQQIYLPGRLSDSERHKLAQDFLQNVKAIKSIPVQTQSTTYPTESSSTQPMTREGFYSPDEMRLLIEAAKGMNCSSGKFYEGLGLTRTQGSRITKRLEKRGLVRTHQFTTGQRGGRVTILEVTSKGQDTLEIMNIQPVQSVTGGGWEHNWAALQIGRIGKREQMKVSYEVDLGEIRVDVVWQDRQGKRTFFNIGISSPEREASNALKAIQMPGLVGNLFVLVARDAAFAKALSSAFKNIKAKPDLLKHIEIRLIADFMDL